MMEHLFDVSAVNNFQSILHKRFFKWYGTLQLHWQMLIAWSKLMYPQESADIDVEAEGNAIYQEFYGADKPLL